MKEGVTSSGWIVSSLVGQRFHKNAPWVMKPRAITQ